MNVNDLMTRLSNGELSNLSMSNEGDGTIAENRQSKIIGYMNDGLLDLYGRFILLERTVVIQMIEGITNYYLLKRFSQSGHDEDSSDPIYIIDALEPFDEDVIKILKVYDSYGREVTLNDETNCRSMFTPRPDLLQVPHPVDGLTLSVTYQARHRRLEPGVMDAAVYLPDVLYRALRQFVAGQTYSHMSGAENSAKGIEFQQKYEVSCENALNHGLVNEAPSTSTSVFEKRGWI